MGTAPETKTFNIHADLLCAHSEFFAAALNKDWKETDERSVELAEDSVEAFELWASYLYGTLLSESEDQTWDTLGTHLAKHEQACTQHHSLLLDAYILGDKMGDFDFTDCMIDELVLFSKDASWYPAVYALKIFENTTETCPLRKFLVDMYTFTAHKDWLDYDVPNEVWADVAKALILEKGRQRIPSTSDAPYSKDPCAYHHHVSRKTACYKTKARWFSAQ